MIVAEEILERGQVAVVMGGQFGSEGKGELIAYLVSHHDVGTVIRTGGPNAGHTMTTKFGTHKMQQVPCGWHVPDTKLIIGPGSLLSPDILCRELRELSKVGMLPAAHNLLISRQATVLESHHREEEEGSDLRDRLGSTREGIGAARAARVWRKARTVGQWTRDGDPNCIYPLSSGHALSDFFTTSASPITEIGNDRCCLIESTQGFGLSLHASGHYPFATSADVTPGQILSDAGISSRFPHTVVAVIRSFPIRVAGNSGPLRGETTWHDLHDQNPLIPDEGERTTVTKKVRRIGLLDLAELRKMAIACLPDAICLTFADYLDPAARQQKTWEGVMGLPMVKSTVRNIEEVIGAPVLWIAVGPGMILEKPTQRVGGIG